MVDGSFQSLEALPIEHLQIVFVASSSSCSEDDTPDKAASTPKPQRQSSVRKSSSFANGDVSPAPPNVPEVTAKTRGASRKTSATKKEVANNQKRTKKAGAERRVGVEEEVLDAPADGWPLRRVVSIEEDHLLQGGPQPFTHQLSEEEALSDDEASLVKGVFVPPPSGLTPGDTEAPAAKKSPLTQVKKTQVSPRGQPVWNETQQVNSTLNPLQRPFFFFFNCCF